MDPIDQEDAAANRQRRSVLVPFLFLLPALVLLGALVVYPIFFSVVRSLYDERETLRGVRQLPDDVRLRATPNRDQEHPDLGGRRAELVTALGLVFAVLSERIRWGTAFKVIIFMPMAVSFLAAGVTWRLVYEEDPSSGVANAAVRGVPDIVAAAGRTSRAPDPPTDQLQPRGRRLRARAATSPGRHRARSAWSAIPPGTDARRRHHGGRAGRGVRAAIARRRCGSTSPGGGGGRPGRSTRPSRACPASKSRRSGAADGRRHGHRRGPTDVPLHGLAPGDVPTRVCLRRTSAPSAASPGWARRW